MYLLNVLPTMLGVVASVLAVVCERMQQFLTIRTRDNMQQGVCKWTRHVKVMLHETIRIDDCLRNTALQSLLRHCFEWLQHCSNIAALCCAKNRCCEWSCVRLHGAIHVPQHLLYSHHALSEIFLYVCRTESKKNPILPCGLGLKVFPFSFFFDNVY